MRGVGVTGPIAKAKLVARADLAPCGSLAERLVKYRDYRHSSTRPCVQQLIESGRQEAYMYISYMTIARSCIPMTMPPKAGIGPSRRLAYNDERPSQLGPLRVGRPSEREILPEAGLRARVGRAGSCVLAQLPEAGAQQPIRHDDCAQRKPQQGS